MSKEEDPGDEFDFLARFTEDEIAELAKTIQKGLKPLMDSVSQQNKVLADAVTASVTIDTGWIGEAVAKSFADLHKPSIKLLAASINPSSDVLDRMFDQLASAAQSATGVKGFEALQAQIAEMTQHSVAVPDLSSQLDLKGLFPVLAETAATAPAATDVTHDEILGFERFIETILEEDIGEEAEQQLSDAGINRPDLLRRWRELSPQRKYSAVIMLRLFIICCGGAVLALLVSGWLFVALNGLLTQAAIIALPIPKRKND